MMRSLSRAALVAIIALLAAVPVGVVAAGEQAGTVSNFDYDAFVSGSRELARFRPGGRVRGIAWAEDGSEVSFLRLGQRLRYDFAAGRLEEVDDEEDEEPGGWGGRRERRRGPGRGRQHERETSPDGNWIAVSRDWNVVIEAAEDDETIAVTTDGTRKRRYGKASWVYGEELEQTNAMWWSPDSRRLVFYEFDERDVPDYYLLRGLTERYTAPEREGYPKPGDPNPRVSLLVYDLETGVTRPFPTAAPSAEDDDEEWYVYGLRFTPDGSEVLVHRTNRHQNVLHIEAADPVTGAVRRVVTETQPTWQTNRPLMQFLADEERFIWETERHGVRQFELRHLDGRRLATLTPDDRPAVDVVRVDEEAGRLYYTAYGADHPLNVHLHRVDLDGTARFQLTPAGASHTPRLSPDGKWFITTAETIELPPTSWLYDADGNRIATLAESEPDLIADFGAPPAELFSFKADDGVTDLYGWLYRPAGFDPERSYPLVIDVYGGPESKGVRNRYRLGHAGTLLGMIVAKIDNRGTGGRGKDFLGAVYQKLGIVDLDDQAAGVRHLVQRPYIDGNRVGIYGHSYGGYMAALAILKHPDLFQVSVAGAAVTDWRNYDTIYTERYMRTPEENPEGYDDGSCLSYASNLSGKLLLLHGMVDDNVHPSNAWQLMEALQEAGRPFEIMFYPNAGHGLGRGAARLRWEFLHEHLVANPAHPG